MVSTNAQVQSKGLENSPLARVGVSGQIERRRFFFLFSSRAKCPGMKWFRNNVVKRQSRQWNALSQQTTQPVHLWKQSCAKQLLYSFFKGVAERHTDMTSNIGKVYCFLFVLRVNKWYYNHLNVLYFASQDGAGHSQVTLFFSPQYQQ